MLKPALPVDEEERLKSLKSLGLLDSKPEEDFDRFTRLAKHLFHVPIALVSLVDHQRQWFKSCQGLDVRETTRDISFCGHAILSEQPLIVNDTSFDKRFADNPLVTGDPKIRFYAGYPLRAPDGSKLGTLCIIDRQPRSLSSEEIAVLADLGKLVEVEIAKRAQSMTDLLTGLMNHRGFFNLLDHTLTLCRRVNRDASLIYFNLDDFNAINQRLTHTAGDEVLKEFALLLSQSFREVDAIGRLDADNFCVIVSGNVVNKLHLPLQDLVEAVALRNKKLHKEARLDFSVGVQRFEPDRHQTTEELIANAVSAMQENKQSKSADQYL